MNGTNLRWVMAAMLCLLVFAASGCEEWDDIAFLHAKKSISYPGIISPPEQIVFLHQWADEAATCTPAEREHRVALLATDIQKESDPWIRLNILRTLSKYRTPVSDAIILTARKDPDLDVRVEACKLLGLRGDAAAVGALREMLVGDIQVDVRLASVKALGQTHEPAVVPQAVAALGTVLEDSNPAIQMGAVESLQRATGKDFGNDVNRWRQFVRGETPAPAQSPSLAERVRNIF
jgi:hypothetical protein